MTDFDDLKEMMDRHIYVASSQAAYDYYMGVDYAVPGGDRTVIHHVNDPQYKQLKRKKIKCNVVKSRLLSKG
jgi:hypothetical protein